MKRISIALSTAFFALCSNAAIAQAMPGVVEGFTKIQVTLIAIGGIAFAILLMVAAFMILGGRMMYLVNVLAAAVVFAFATPIAVYMMG